MKTNHKIFIFFFIVFIPISLAAQELQFKPIKEITDLPEEFCSIWEKGDFLISFGPILGIMGGVSRAMLSITNYPMGDAGGSILSLVTAGDNLKSNLCIGSPYLRIKNRQKTVSYSDIVHKPSQKPEEPPAIHVTGFYTGTEGEKADIQTVYQFLNQPDKINIISTIKNTGTKILDQFEYSLYVNSSTSYYFSPWNKEKFPALNFRVFQKIGHCLGWINHNPTDIDPPERLAPEESYTVSYSLLIDTDGASLLKRIYQILNIRSENTLIVLENHAEKPAEIIVSDALSGAIFYRNFFEGKESFKIPLPTGTYSARANFFPAVSNKLFSVSSGEENLCKLSDLPKGKVSVRIINSGNEYVPGKVTFLGIEPTKTPYFLPDNPITSGRRWESFKNSRFPRKDGEEISLPVGTYIIHASRGLEYSVDQKVLEVLENDQKSLIFRIDKVVNTQGLISVDTHMHTQNSDGRVGFLERIRSVVAEGVDVAISTDHNFISNYIPHLHSLGLENYLGIIYGNEVTISGMIHYNSFPVGFREQEKNHGAINPLSDSVSQLFSRSRTKDPRSLIQVNHPRSGRIGYFNTHLLDEESAASAHEDFDTSFDVLEILNGPLNSDDAQAIKDWLHLLNRGYYFPLVASSDSHTIDKGEPGFPRTYVFYEGGKGTDLNQSALILAIKAGRSFASNGPIVDFKINHNYRSGDTLTDRDGEVDVELRIQSAPWISTNEVRLIINGKRRIGFPVKKTDQETLDFSRQLKVKLRQDSYIVVEVLGNSSLYPVVQRTARNGRIDRAILPYAITNPIFIDFDGNGKFDPPLKEKIQFVSGVTGTAEKK
ncbi:MAG: CehA/McbA family metallohydrolase [Deltaproteobacteria bacterium]|nr:CehA/McbA family metallohydrolase [Deltaproteobacteria bacterium]